MLKPLSIHIKRSWIIWTKFYYNCLSDRGGQLWMKFCAADKCRQAVFLLAHKIIVFSWSLFYSPQKTAWELFIFWLQGNQSFSDKLRFRSQKYGTLIFRVAGAYVPTFFPNLFRDRATSFLLFKAVAQGGSSAAALFSLFLFL